MVTRSMSKYLQLVAQRKKLDNDIEAARLIAAQGAIEQCLELISTFSLTAVDLGFVKTQQIPTKKVKKSDKTFAVKVPKVTHPPKYVDPASGKTWSGRGHQPGWIVSNRDDYLIKEGAPHKRITQNNKDVKVA